MPLDVDNVLLGVELWFGCEALSEIDLLYHLNSCATMNTSNLNVHQLLMTAHPNLVAEYIQYDDSNPFQPLQLSCAVRNLEIAESVHDKLTAIDRY